MIIIRSVGGRFGSGSRSSGGTPSAAIRLAPATDRTVTTIVSPVVVSSRSSRVISIIHRRLDKLVPAVIFGYAASGCCEILVISIIHRRLDTLVPAVIFGYAASGCCEILVISIIHRRLDTLVPAVIFGYAASGCCEILGCIFLGLVKIGFCPF